jgi:inositol oxygenase
MKKNSFRNYNETRDEVKELYKEQRINQCQCYVQRMHSKYLPYSPECDKIITMSCWDALISLSKLTDKSDPDSTIPNIEHAFQTAECIKNANFPEWMQLVGLLHDLGKVIYIKGCQKDGTDVDTQYGVVGDTYPVAFKSKSVIHSDKLVFPEFNGLCKCACQKQTFSSSNNDIIGFSNCLFTFGHDEYLWQILHHNSKRPFSKLKISEELPWEFLYFIRFHSFYAWHKHGAYEELADEFDKMAVNKLREFSSFDLYSKSDKHFDPQELKSYYDKLMIKYLGCSLDDGLEW